MSTRQLTGQRGEQLVADRLIGGGFRIVGRNVRVGRLEIDLIAARGRLLVFCEVRTRFSDEVVDPFETIDVSKRERIRRAASQWLTTQRIAYDEIRFDAASVVLATDVPSVDYFEDAF